MTVVPFSRKSPRLAEINSHLRKTFARVKRDITSMQEWIKQAREECRRVRRSFDNWARSGECGIQKTQIYNILKGVFSVHPVNVPQKKEAEYILTPLDRWDQLHRVLRINYDAYPFPREKGFNSLTEEYGTRTYTNPMFDDGIAACVRKNIEEFKKGKFVLTVLPLNAMGAIARLLCAGAVVFDVDIPNWRSRYDGFSTSPKPAHQRQPCIWLVLDPNPPPPCPTCGHRGYHPHGPAFVGTAG
jgi:hypothetical protein